MKNIHKYNAFSPKNSGPLHSTIGRIIFEFGHLEYVIKLIIVLYHSGFEKIDEIDKDTFISKLEVAEKQYALSSQLKTIKHFLENKVENDNNQHLRRLNVSLRLSESLSYIRNDIVHGNWFTDDDGTYICLRSYYKKNQGLVTTSDRYRIDELEDIARKIRWIRYFLSDLSLIGPMVPFPEGPPARRATLVGEETASLLVKGESIRITSSEIAAIISVSEELLLSAASGEERALERISTAFGKIQMLKRTVDLCLQAHKGNEELAGQWFREERQLNGFKPETAIDALKRSPTETMSIILAQLEAKYSEIRPQS